MRTTIVLIFLALRGIVLAQSSASAKLMDADDFSSIPYATVYNVNSRSLATANENGVFQIEGSASDSVQIACLGYVQQTLPFSYLGKNKEIKLQKNPSLLQEVSVVAGRAESPGVQYIDKLTLKLIPVNNAQDLLRTVSGLFIAQHAGGGKAEQIFLRGFDNDHGTDFGVFIDDIPVNLSNHAHGQGYADMHFVIPELIQDADYYKGPYEMKNGNFAVSGAARYKTKNGIEKNMVKYEIGDFGYHRGLVAINLTPKNKIFTKNNYEKAYIALEGTLNRSFFDAPQDFRKVSGVLKYNTQLGENTSLIFSNTYFNSDWKASGQIPLRATGVEGVGWYGAIDDTEGGATARLNSSLKLASFLKKNQSISNQVYYANNQYNLFSNFTFFLNDPVNGDMIEQVESRHIVGYTFEYEREDKIKNSNIKTTLSTGVRSDWVNLELITAVKRERLEVQDKNKLNETNYWAYIKEDWQLNKKVLLQFGSRFDLFHFGITDQLENHGRGTRVAHRFSPKASLFYNPIEKVQFFVKGASGYHSNYTHAAIEDRNIHPLPRALSADLGTEFKIGERFIATASLWTIKSDAEYIFLADTGDFENNGSSLRRGLDIATKYEPLKNVWIDLSVNFSKGILLDEAEGENSIPSAPRLTSTSSVVYKHAKGFDFYLGTRYMAERPLTEDEAIIAKAYFLLDASVNYTFKNIQIGLSAQNILNEQWKEAVFYDASRLKNEITPVDDIHFTPGTPRYIKGSISYLF